MKNSSPIFASFADLSAAADALAAVKFTDPKRVNYLTLTDAHIKDLAAAAKAEGANKVQRICGLALRGDPTARLAAATEYNARQA